MAENKKETLTITPLPTSLHEISREWLNSSLIAIEQAVEKDVLALYGQIEPSIDIRIRLALERLDSHRETLLVILDTPGGLVEVVQRIVKTLRHFYKIVHFLVPERAMSAGTVLVMSGDAIYMDYFSCLGPIDPQIQRDGRVVPGLSYLRQYQRFVEKAASGENLTTAEFALLNKLDLAELHQIELAAELSKSLIQEWLSTYKFKDWRKNNAPIAIKIKQKRAEEIANKLNDHQKWYTHGYGIHKDILENDLKLKIDDYSDDPKLKKTIWQYFWPFREYCMHNQSSSLIHTRSFL